MVNIILFIMCVIVPPTFKQKISFWQYDSFHVNLGRLNYTILDSVKVGGGITLKGIEKQGSYLRFFLNDGYYYTKPDTNWSTGGGILAGECHDSCDNVREDIRDSVNVIGIAWENISGKPSCFTACAHTHLWNEITNPPVKYDSAKNADSLYHYSYLRFVDTTRFKLDSANLANHTHSGLAPSGGATGYVLKKNSATNYDYSWAVDATGGGGSANPGRAYQWHTIEPHDAATKYASGGANRARIINFYLSCSLVVNKVMWRGRLTATIKATDVGIYDSLGTKLWSAGSTIPTTLNAGICSTTVSPTLRLGPGQYYAAWACSSASKDTIYGVAVGVAGQRCRTGYKAACFPLPATIVPTTITKDVGCIWMCLRDN